MGVERALSIGEFETFVSASAFHCYLIVYAWASCSR